MRFVRRGSVGAAAGAVMVAVPLALAGCGGDTTGSTPPPPPENAAVSPSPVAVALLAVAVRHSHYLPDCLADLITAVHRRRLATRTAARPSPTLTQTKIPLPTVSPTG